MTPGLAAVVIIPSGGGGGDLGGWGLVILIGWLVGTAIAWVPLTRFLLKSETGMGDDTVDLCLTIALGLLVAAFWPLFIPGAWVYGRVKSDTKESVRD